ncbi:MAG: YebC/PmpR family DNA-binding transcriptional regulator [Bacteroidales bacterium]|jgi:YebC/PmpR family DNA-binding regulatory protein|nr:YebC/PmpR family DNA-binding transcriptional regulator [Bacteroidales bacterium]MEE3406392.1 YebC/PmpR family DNA-binding transcriptional regulator [Candidatus Cryptobacteroides sp.]SKC41294.1 DNA-binding regulatory protein, YebC/PmpR family [Bacteroidales bacterium WCE2008]MBO7366060.1 YebC/PmpR family DNA-binding transcriptional regulator [Bacteroidales bacterium]MBP5234954.1 YebC/PmpR family DNA-binding transcriptional regulator [Bacteroidales bacterium]
MGRAFEFRKERKMKRWGHMAKVFTKLGKEITIAVKQGGPDVVGNPRLRALMAEARSESMPKENIERAIKKATEKNAGDFKEVVFEGYGPHGIAYLVETATDNNTRTVANVRSYFTKCGGSLGTSGSVAFMFDHKCVFRIKEDPAKPVDLEELELELIDLGLDELFEQEVEDEDENVTKEIVIYGDYTAYGAIQKFIEENGYELISGGFERIPNVDLKEVTPEQRATLDKLTGLLEDDEDVTNVYTTLKPSDEE